MERSIFDECMSMTVEEAQEFHSNYRPLGWIGNITRQFSIGADRDDEDDLSEFERDAIDTLAQLVIRQAMRKGIDPKRYPDMPLYELGEKAGIRWY